MQNKTKFAALVIALAMVFGVSTSAGAVTIAELQAQINALMAQLAALQGGSATTNTNYTFTQNLTVGSTGADVTSLQQMLVGGGYLNMPTGVSYGYFGPLTKAAVAAWQAANNVAPAVGYWGPISRAAANAMAPSTPGTTPGSTVGITTPGVEGTITVSKNPSPASGAKVYEGDSKKAVLGVKIEAKTSDMRVERIKLDLDETGNTATSDSAFYNKFATTIYVMDGSTVLASSDLNSSTVITESGEITITLAGFSIVVPKDTTKVLTIALDAKSSWDSDYDSDTWTVGVPASGVRAIDGAGVNQYGPSTAFVNSVTGTADILESSTLAIATDANTPATAEVIAANGTSENELDGLELLRFTARAEKDEVKITDVVATITRGVGTVATATTAYLYDGSTLIGSATVAGTTATAMSATFSDLTYWVPKDTTKVLSLKVDIDSADSTGTTFVGSIAASTGITAERPNGDDVSESGSATGETLTLRNAGPEFTIKSATPAYTAAAGYAGATSTAKSTFVIGIKAVGSDLYFGTQAASSTFEVATFKGGAAVAADYANGSTTGYIIPSSGVVTSGLPAAAVAFKLAEGQSVDVTVENVFPGRLTVGTALATDGYAFGIKVIRWSTTGNDTSESTFMSGKTTWRTSSVTMP